MNRSEQFIHQADQYDTWQRDTIRRYGWALQAVLAEGDSPPFVYTVGLTGFGHPELILFATTQATAATVLNELGEMVPAGARLEAGRAARVSAGRVQLLAFPDSADWLLAAQSLYRRSGAPPAPVLLVVPEDGLVETPGEDRPCPCCS
ncbi:DUF4262 domain-containing protein [Pseudonocardia asaccharolytica]|nr:DUF4262 domain-containing protein [Pseudonocardia asaccharolytica]